VTTTFPTTLDSYATVPVNQNVVTQHRSRHQNVEDAVEAIEAKVGVTNSAVTTSLDYRVKQLETASAVFIPFTFTPVATFATPGDLSVAYTTQLGYGARMGKFVFLDIVLTFTPTFTTASGEFRITGLPDLAVNATERNAGLTIANLTTGWTWPASATQLVGQVPTNTQYVRMLGHGNGITSALLSTAHVPSGTLKGVTLSGLYVMA
jgi:hypothetical protein